MFAIIEDGGRQYRIQPGQELAIDLRKGVEEGADLTFDRILLANGGADSVIGSPMIENATIAASVISPVHKGLKVEIQKFRRRKNSRRHTGHRQKYTTVQIGEFSIPGLEIVEKQEESQPAAEESPSESAESAES